uniref:Uncharacterized protein n=1 Tax=Arundo donax TaxID=35708 RepID=A0A0A8ZM81_ARUDO
MFHSSQHRKSYQITILGSLLQSNRRCHSWKHNEPNWIRVLGSFQQLLNHGLLS